jgi:hypothetical protein
MTANLDQARDRAYISEALDHLKKETKKNKIDGKTPKKKWCFSLVTLFEVVLTALRTKKTILNDLNIISNKDLARIVDKFNGSLLEQLQNLLQKPKKFMKAGKGDQMILSLDATIEALAAMDVDEANLAELADGVNTLISSLNETQQALAMRLETFMTSHALNPSKSLRQNSEDEPSTVFGRQSIEEKANALTVEKNQVEKLEILKSMCERSSSPLTQLDRLFAAKIIIFSCDGAFR